MSGKRLSFGNMPEMPYATLEALNRLRINIGFLGHDIRKIMVVSSVPDEGKSFVAMQLWHQMAEAGTRSALLDADLRKSVAADKYRIKADGGGKIQGTSHCLSGDAPLQEAFYRTEWEAGDILPNTDNVVNPSMLLESGRFSDLLDYAAGEYRYVFIDSPPLGVVSDGERIASLCDGAIVVIRGGMTAKGLVRNSVAQLGRAGCPVLGFVLNRVGGARSGYYYKRYGGRYGRYGRYYGRYGRYGHGGRYADGYYGGGDPR